MAIEKSKVIAFIPARGGSKGVKNKNIIDLDGIPLIMWSIFAAVASKCVDRIVVSSDSRDILFSASFHSRHVCQEVDCLQRDSSLAKDSSTTESVIDDFIENDDKISNNDIILLMQPTSPF
ncbi:MAG: acylneuraminate cytidylyltransferase family protein, partial [Pelagibacterales bacterium]|nr:acylneuraminate cytidylyltransferase family protein [Pelagibacterales bacterium]